MTSSRCCWWVVTSLLSVTVLVLSIPLLLAALSACPPPKPTCLRSASLLLVLAMALPLAAAAQQITVSAAASLTDALIELGAVVRAPMEAARHGKRHPRPRPCCCSRSGRARRSTFVRLPPTRMPWPAPPSRSSSMRPRAATSASNALVLIEPAGRARRPAAPQTWPARASVKLPWARPPPRRRPLHAAGAGRRGSLERAGAEVRAARCPAPGAPIRGPRRGRGRFRLPHRCGRDEREGPFRLLPTHRSPVSDLVAVVAERPPSPAGRRFRGPFLLLRPARECVRAPRLRYPMIDAHP